MKRGIFQKKKNRETFKPYNVFGKSGVDREPSISDVRPCNPTATTNSYKRTGIYGNGSSYLVNYSNNVANMKEKPYEVFPPLGRNVSFVAYVNSIKAFAAELLPFPEEEENEDDKVKTPTQKTRKNGFIAKWVKERTEGCDAWRDLMYIPEPPRVQVMQKVARERAAVPATSNAAGSGGAPKLSAAAAAAAAAEQSHARALAAAKSQQRILAPPAAPAPMQVVTLKKSDSFAKPTLSAREAARRSQAHPDTSFSSANLSGW